MDNRFDYIVIGSGLGGLVTSNILAKKGYKVAIVEKNPIAGGCLHSFKKDGVIFDTGIHYVGGLSEGQVLYRLFRYLGIYDRLKIRPLDKEAFDRFILEGEEFVFATGYERFRARLVSYFPEEEKAIDTFIQKIKEISYSEALYNLEPFSLDMNILDEKYNYGNAWQFISSITGNNKLRQILSGLNSLHGGSRDSSFLYIHALITNHFIESAYRFVDGSSQVADALVKAFEGYGGKIYLNSKITKFYCEDKTLKYIEDQKSEKYFGDRYISDIHPYHIMEMIGSGAVRESYRRRIKELKNTMSTFSLYVCLHDKKVPYMNSNYYYCPGGDVWVIDKYSSAEFPLGIGVYPVADSIDEKYTRGLSVLTFMDYDEVSQWENSSLEERNTDYIRFKEDKAEKMLKMLDELFPGIRKHIKSYTTATPLTLKDYTGTYRGSTYGIDHDFRIPNQSVLFPRTKIPNLFLTGQNLSLHGFMGVSMASLLTCSEFLDLDQLLKEINNA